MTIRHACIGFMGFLAGCGAVNDSTAEEEVAFVSSAPPATSAIPAVAHGDDVLQSLNSDTGCLNTGDGDTTLRFINRCPFPVVFAGTRIPGGRLDKNAQACQTVGKNWEHMISMRYWGFREGSDPGYGRRSLAEFGSANSACQGSLVLVSRSSLSSSSAIVAVLSAARQFIVRVIVGKNLRRFGKDLLCQEIVEDASTWTAMSPSLRIEIANL